MQLAYNIPCPTISTDCIEELIRKELREALVDPSTAKPGDVVAIAQSWFLEGDTVKRDTLLNYWKVSEDHIFNPTVFRTFTEDKQIMLGKAAAHLLDNIHARSVVSQQIIAMKKSPTGRWIDAIHTADGILLLEADAGMSQLRSSAQTGRLSQDVKFVACPAKSQHERSKNMSSVKALLKGISGRLIGTYPDEDDYCLAPGLI